MEKMVRNLVGFCMAGLVVSAVGMGGCTDTIRTLENDSFKVTVNRLNVAAFEEFTLSVYVEPIGEKLFRKNKLLELEGPGDIEGTFIGQRLLLLKLWSMEDFPIYLEHILLRIPMKCEEPISYETDSPNDPFVSDTIPYAVESFGNRKVFYDSTSFEKGLIIRTVDISQFIYTRSIFIAPVEQVTGELFHEDTLRLSVTWCGDNKRQDILVKLPTSKSEDLEYLVRE